MEEEVGEEVEAGVKVVEEMAVVVEEMVEV